MKKKKKDHSGVSRKLISRSKKKKKKKEKKENEYHHPDSVEGDTGQGPSGIRQGVKASIQGSSNQALVAKDESVIVEVGGLSPPGLDPTHAALHEHGVFPAHAAHTLGSRPPRLVPGGIQGPSLPAHDALHLVKRQRRQRGSRGRHEGHHVGRDQCRVDADAGVPPGMCAARIAPGNWPLYLLLPLLLLLLWLVLLVLLVLLRVRLVRGY